MRWTCQAEPGPLWWPLDRADHWYRPDTDPERLAAEFLRAHPHHGGGPVLVRWWVRWSELGREVRVEPEPAAA